MNQRVPGFTLIEILVVLFIISIMSGIVVANLPQFARTGDYDLQARRLKVLMEMARDDALLQADEYGFRPEPDGYRFFVYDDLGEAWSEIETRPYQARQLEDGMTLRLEVEDSTITLGGGDDDEQGEGDGQGARDAPPVLLLSSGETTPFRLTIATEDENWSKTLVADGYGELKWADEQDEQ